MSNASCADLVGAVQQQSNNVMSPLKKRASTVELNGKCYLAIEPEARDARTARNPLEPSVYRGGVGTVPRDRYFSMISYNAQSFTCLKKPVQQLIGCDYLLYSPLSCILLRSCGSR